MSFVVSQQTVMLLACLVLEVQLLPPYATGQIKTFQ